MIVLDTNVISELWRIKPDSNVQAWLDAQVTKTLYLSTITVAELRYGIAAMPEGKRRTIYQRRLEDEVLAVFAERILTFDLNASKSYADLMVRAQAEGKTISTADGYIAAIAASHKLMVATRDISPFKVCGLLVINPWSEFRHD